MDQPDELSDLRSALARHRRVNLILGMLLVGTLIVVGLWTVRSRGSGERSGPLRFVIVDHVDYDQIGDTRGTRREERTADHNRRIARILVSDLIEALRNPNEVIIEPALDGNANSLLDRHEADAVVVIGPQYFQTVDELTLNDITGPDGDPGRSSFGPRDAGIRVVFRNDEGTRHQLIVDELRASVLKTVTPYVMCKNLLFATRMESQCSRYAADADAPRYDPARQN